MLTIAIRNDGTGDRETGNYDVAVYVNGVVIERVRVEGHRRADGWRELVRMLADSKKNEVGNE